MMLPRHLQLVGSEIYTDFYSRSYIPVVENFSRQGLNEDPASPGLEEVVEAVKLFVKAMNYIAARTMKMI